MPGFSGYTGGGDMKESHRGGIYTVFSRRVRKTTCLYIRRMGWAALSGWGGAEDLDGSRYGTEVLLNLSSG